MVKYIYNVHPYVWLQHMDFLQHSESITETSFPNQFYPQHSYFFAVSLSLAYLAD